MADIRLYNLCLIENPETRQVVALDKVSSPFAGITLPGARLKKGKASPLPLSGRSGKRPG